MTVEYKELLSDKRKALLSWIYEDIERVACKVPDEDKIQGARFFITGGTGSVGIWLTRLLLYASKEKGWRLRLTLLTRDIEKLRKRDPDLAEEVELIEGDIRSFPFPKGSYEYVVHAATDTNGMQNEENPLDLLSSIVDGTKRVLEFACRCKCHKMLYVSSGAVYDKHQNSMTSIPESCLLAPDICGNPCSSAYGEGKRMGELLCLLYSKKGKRPTSRTYPQSGRSVILL